jgi:hypothetical protein
VIVYLSLALGGGGTKRRMEIALTDQQDPTVYLASNVGRSNGNRSRDALRVPDEPSVYLAHSPGAQGDNALIEPAEGRRELTGRLIPDALRPPLLISYFYVRKFIEEQPRYRYRHWALDSGAFSAHNSGQTIELADYIRFCRERLAADPTLREVFALDVIGDWRAGLRNTERMWREGVPAIPCYHIGEPEEVLVGLARDYPKIAIGGMAKLKGQIKRRFVEQCFARIWPKRVHGFGVGTKELILLAPWHSVDATNWEVGPCKFGSWKSFGGADLRVRGSAHDLRNEIAFYAELEKLARHRWAREMAELGGGDEQGDGPGAAAPGGTDT